MRDDFNPRSPHGERPHTHAVQQLGIPISIHALLTESDREGYGGRSLDHNFNPRSPHGERHGTAHLGPYSFGFQSTLSSRRATVCLEVRRNHREISIHALLTESDDRRFYFSAFDLVFQSTLSSRRATRSICALQVWNRFQSTLSSRRATPTEDTSSTETEISIHALLTESDG